MFRLLVLITVYVAFARPAYAYIDAALGSLVLQSLAAGFFTFMMFWRSWLQKVKNFFGGKSDADVADSEKASGE